MCGSETPDVLTESSEPTDQKSLMPMIVVPWTQSIVHAVNQLDHSSILKTLFQRFCCSGLPLQLSPCVTMSRGKSIPMHLCNCSEKCSPNVLQHYQTFIFTSGSVSAHVCNQHAWVACKFCVKLAVDFHSWVQPQMSLTKTTMTVCPTD